jgi:HSP20 family protein
VPLADVYETAEGFVVQVDLPGLRDDEVEVHVDGDRLVLRGDRRPSETARPDNYYRMERSYGPFSRTFILTPHVDPDRVTATFKDGLLRLELPKVRPRPAWRGERGEA